MNYNFHTHTVRCHHAEGAVEEYIKCAVQGGIRYMGFSEHVPYICSDGVESGFRMPYAQAKEYVSEISTLREQYQNQIEIYIGFEMEYYELQFEKMLNDAIQFGGEYLILGQHFIREESPDGVYCNQKTDDVGFVQDYVSGVIKAMETGAFTYVAHPDIIRFDGDVDVFQQEMRPLCIASKKYDVPLEINFLGIRGNRNYPNEAFWKIAGEEQCPVTFGFDAHDPEAAADHVSLKKAMELVSTYQLNYIGKPKLRLLKLL